MLLLLALPTVNVLAATDPSSRFVTSQGTLFEEFETTSGWTATQCTLDISSDKKQGNYSLKLSTSQTAGYATKTISLTFLSTSVFTLWVKVSLIANITSLALYFSSSSTFASYFLITIAASALKTGWNRLAIYAGDFTSSGGESWSNVMIRMRIRANLPSGKSVDIYWDDYRNSYDARPIIILSFDDGWSSIYSTARPIMNMNDQQGSAFVITSLVGNTGRMGLPELRTLQDQGWDICSHGKTHVDLTTLSMSQLQSEVYDAYNWLVDNSFITGSYFFAYPYGKYNSTVIDVVNDKHLAARTAIEGYRYFPHVTLDGDMEYTMKIFLVLNTTSVATLQAEVDRAINRKGLLILVFHKIEDNAYVSTIYPTANFQSISNYIASRSADVDVLTFSQYFSIELPQADSPSPMQQPLNIMHMSLSLLGVIIVIAAAGLILMIVLGTFKMETMLDLIALIFVVIIISIIVLIMMQAIVGS